MGGCAALTRPTPGRPLLRARTPLLIITSCGHTDHALVIETPLHVFASLE